MEARSPSLPAAPDEARRLFLPHLLREVSEAHGLDAALSLAQHFGGAEIKVPRLARASHPIAVACGMPAMRWLCEAYSGCVVAVPLGPQSRSLLIGQKVQTMTAEGKSARETARALGVTQRTVRAWRRRLREGGAKERKP